MIRVKISNDCLTFLEFPQDRDRFKGNKIYFNGPNYISCESFPAIYYGISGALHLYTPGEDRTNDNLGVLFKKKDRTLIVYLLKKFASVYDEEIEICQPSQVLGGL